MAEASAGRKGPTDQEAAIGHVGRTQLREEAAETQAYPESPFRRKNSPQTNRTLAETGSTRKTDESEGRSYRRRNCGLYAHDDCTAAIIIRNRALRLNN